MAKSVLGQSGLKLVFRNGCSTEGQVSHWIAAGVRRVIATTQRVNGEVAGNFAARFYKGLATGASIKVAYDEAVGEATAACGGKSRLVCVDDEDEPALKAESGRWPWFLQTAPEAVLFWNGIFLMPPMTHWPCYRCLSTDLFRMLPIPDFDVSLPPMPRCSLGEDARSAGSTNDWSRHLHRRWFCLFTGILITSRRRLKAC